MHSSQQLLLQLVLGPAIDGGYYLLGTTVAAEQLFEVLTYLHIEFATKHRVRKHNLLNMVLSQCVSAGS